MGEAMKFYAHRKGKGFHHIYTYKIQVKMCGNDPIVQIELIENKEGEYYGWKENNKVSLIQLSFVQLDMCFPGGVKHMEEISSGKIVRLTIKDTT